MLLIAIISGGSLFAQENKKTEGKKFMQINTVEPVVSGGLGRSKMTSPTQMDHKTNRTWKTFLAW